MAVSVQTNHIKQQTELVDAVIAEKKQWATAAIFEKTFM
jgi:hypothetical protein